MDAPQNIPLTIISQITAKPGPSYLDSKIFIGNNNYIPAGQPQKVYWALIIDRTSQQLNVIENFTFTDNHSIPTQLTKYNNDPRYLLILSTRYTYAFNIPQGDFYNYLVNQFKAGSALQRLEQILGAAVSGTNYMMSYTLVSTFDGSLEEPIEYSETGNTHYETYTLQLVPEENPNGNGILYIPYPLF